MTTEQFRSTLHLQPFRPFTIRMADDQTFEVSHPDFVAQSPTGRTVIVFQRDDSYSVLDMHLMSAALIANSTPGKALRSASRSYPPVIRDPC